MTQLLDLPTEVLTLIATFIDAPSTLRAFKLVNRELNTIASQERIDKCLFDHNFDPACFYYNYEEELKTRWEYLREEHLVEERDESMTVYDEPLELCFARFTNLLKHVHRTVCELRMPHGRNVEFVQLRAFDFINFLERDLSLTNIAKYQYIPCSILMLYCSYLCQDTIWEQELLADNPEGADDLIDSVDAMTMFTQYHLFAPKVTRKDGSMAFADIPPTTFGGLGSYSDADWLLFACIMKFMIYFINTSLDPSSSGEHDLQRPCINLSPASPPIAKRTSWLGIYVYADFLTYQRMTLRRAKPIKLSHDHLYSDGIQTCNIDMHDDGTVSGDGRGTYERTSGGRFTIHGTWTQVSDCPSYFRRITFHKKYSAEEHESNWLYDGVVVSGLDGSIFLGRWKDDTHQFELSVTGPFIFWTK